MNSSMMGHIHTYGQFLLFGIVTKALPVVFVDRNNKRLDWTHEFIDGFIEVRYTIQIINGYVQSIWFGILKHCSFEEK